MVYFIGIITNEWLFLLIVYIIYNQQYLLYLTKLIS